MARVDRWMRQRRRRARARVHDGSQGLEGTRHDAEARRLPRVGGMVAPSVLQRECCESGHNKIFGFTPFTLLDPRISPSENPSVFCLDAAFPSLVDRIPVFYSLCVSSEAYAFKFLSSVQLFLSPDWIVRLVADTQLTHTRALFSHLLASHPNSLSHTRSSSAFSSLPLHRSRPSLL